MSHDAPLDHLNSAEKSPQLRQCWERLWVGGRNEGRQEVCFCCQVPVLLVRGRATHLLELCYSRVKLGAEDLISPRSQLGSPHSSKSRAGGPPLAHASPWPAARQAMGKGCVSGAQSEAACDCRACCLVPAVCPGFCWQMVTGKCLLEGLAPSMGSGMCSQIWAQQGFFACVNIRKQKPDAGKY